MSGVRHPKTRSFKITGDQPPVTLKLEVGIYDLTDPYPGYTANASFTPNHLDRSITVQVVDGANAVIRTVQITARFDSGKKAYLANVPVNLDPGTYLVKVRLSNTLTQAQPGFFSVTATTTLVAVPRIVTLIGDVDGNNRVDLADYDLLVGCYSDFAPPKSCSADRIPSPGNQPSVDLNDDGKVNAIDINLILRLFNNQHGT